MKSATPLLAPSRKRESGFRPLVRREPENVASFLEDIGEEATPVEWARPHLVAATASRADALDDAPFSHDDAPTIAMPVDVSSILSILAARGLASPLGDAPAPTPPSWPAPSLHPPLALRAADEHAAPATIHVIDRAPPSHALELTLVAMLSFVLTIVAGAGVAWALGAPLVAR
jgi:hypothetical protein